MKTSRITLLIISVLLYNVLILFLFHKHRNIPGIEANGNPSDVEQFYMMKKNEQGIIPGGVGSAIWNDYMKKKVRAQSNLANITELGPINRGGRTRSMIIDITNHNHLFAGAVSGGLWKSTDKGINWHPVNDFSPTLAVTALAQDPLNADIIYYGTGESTGNSADLPGDGIFKSTDHGANFVQLASTTSATFTDGIWKIAVLKNQPNTLLVGTNNGGLQKSTNGGSTFTQVYANGTKDVTDIEIFPDGKILICVKADGIYKSTSNGDAGTFTRLSNGLPAGANTLRAEIAYCDSFPDVVYAQIENSTQDGLEGMYKSTDGGENWFSIISPETAASYYFPWYASMICVKPDNPNIVISGCVYMTYSKNGGITGWSVGKLSQADDHFAVFDPDNLDEFYVNNDAGVFRYNINTMGSSYTGLRRTYNATQFYAGAYFPTGLNCIGGCQDNSTLLCKNGDSVFTIPDPTNGDGTYCQVNQQQPDISYLEWQYGRIRRSENTLTSPSFYKVRNELDADDNGGIDDGAWFNTPFEINMLDGSQLYYTTYRRLWRTTNGGDNWVPVTNYINASGVTPFAIGVSHELYPTVYIGGSGALFYRVDNAYTAVAGNEVNLHSSLPSQISSTFIACITVHPDNSSVLYVGLSPYSLNPRVWKVTNAKSATPVWENISGDLPTNLPVNWVEADPLNPDSFLVIGTDFGLYTTTNGGTNWNLETQIPYVAIQQVRLRYSDRKLFIFTHGRGIWVADLINLPTSIGSLKKYLSAQIQMYPNPASNILNVKLNEILKEKNIITEIYNLKGELIESISAGYREQYSIDISKFKSGVYFLRLKNEGDYIYSGKFVKL
ncbi:MAG: T9SS type A sorting domain-containing protein [Bacteroidales bacterium]|nr:T9SS type A sorting domain-containing protein [Bacteroidales bacterium]